MHGFPWWVYVHHTNIHKVMLLVHKAFGETAIGFTGTDTERLEVTTSAQQTAVLLIKGLGTDKNVNMTLNKHT